MTHWRRNDSTPTSATYIKEKTIFPQMVAPALHAPATLMHPCMSTQINTDKTF